MKLKPYEYFINEYFILRKLLETYLELRQHFQELDFSENDLESPPTYTEKMMKKINELTPLKENGNNKRRNRWDED
jgi:hypothetical protein